MKLSRIVILICGLLIGGAAIAQTPDPMTMLHAVSDRMLAALKENRPRLHKDSNYIYTLVDKIVVPYVDVQGMSRSVLGRTAWIGATPGQQKDFSSAFKHVVISTYASALNAYTDETIRFFPIRGGYQGKQRLTVNSQVIRSDGGPPVALNYSLALLNGEWKMYDLNVEGVSLLQSFHAQFAEQLSQGKNIVTITRELRNRGKK